MTAGVAARAGWRPLPLPLKILPVVMGLWAVGSAMNLPNLMAGGLPFFGAWVDGVGAAAIAVFFDFVAPLVFLFALFGRKPWAPVWAALYIGLFVLNGLIAAVVFGQQLSLAQIAVPCGISLAILGVILWQRGYFTQADAP